MNGAQRSRPRPLGWLTILGWALLVGGASQVPNWIGRAQAGTTTFLGTLAPWPEDMTYHLSFAEQAKRGALLFEDKYNGNRVGTRLIFNSYFLALGNSARLLGISVIDAALAAKTVLAVLLLWTAYCFAAPYLGTRGQQVLFLILAPFGSGLGWLSAWGAFRPFDSLDLWAVEVSTFRAMADDMIVPITTTLLLLALSLLDRALAEPSRRRAIVCGLAALGLGTVHPHDLLVTFNGVAVLLVLLRSFVPSLREKPPGTNDSIRFSRWRVLVWVLACSMPILAYDAYILWREPLFWNYVALDDALRPAPLAAGFGLPMILAVFGGVRGLRQAPARYLMPVIWIVAALGLLFVPIPPCRQFFLLHGVQMGLCLLATWPLAWLWQRAAERPPPGGCWVSARRIGTVVLFATLMASSCLTTVVHWRAWARLLHERAPERFAPADVAAAMRWLEEHADPASTLLAGEAASRLAPALAGVRVFAAQDQQTVDYARRKDAVSAFFRARAGRDARSFLEKQGVRYVLVGTEERRMGGPELTKRLDLVPGLTKVLKSEGLALYEATRDGDAGHARDAHGR